MCHMIDAYIRFANRNRRGFFDLLRFVALFGIPYSVSNLYYGFWKFVVFWGLLAVLVPWLAEPLERP